MKRINVMMMLLLVLLLVACGSGGDSSEVPNPDDGPEVIVYRSPTWGCCGDWVGYMRENGYRVEAKDMDDLTPIKAQYQIPQALQSCHTAIVDGYVIEGHVPVEDVNRLLTEKPDVIGLAVPGMPTGSPGMEGPNPVPFDVVAFTVDGSFTIFANHTP